MHGAFNYFFPARVFFFQLTSNLECVGMKATVNRAVDRSEGNVAQPEDTAVDLG
jgi:hypothetical protein